MTLASGLYDVPPGHLACVVTSLEMRARPAPAETSAPPGLRLRHVPAPDPSWYRALFRSIGQDWLWCSRLALSDADLITIIRDPLVEVISLVSGDVDRGLVELDFREPGVCEIAFFGLTAPLTGRGIGSWLMAQAIERAWSRPMTRLWLHTCTLDHPGAIRFYRRHGFSPFKSQVEILDDPRASGLLPADAAPHIVRL